MSRERIRHETVLVVKNKLKEGSVRSMEMTEETAAVIQARNDDG